MRARTFFDADTRVMPDDQLAALRGLSGDFREAPTVLCRLLPLPVREDPTQEIPTARFELPAPPIDLEEDRERSLDLGAH